MPAPLIADFARELAKGFDSELVVEVDPRAAEPDRPAASSYRTLTFGLEPPEHIWAQIEQTGVAPERTVIAVGDIARYGTEIATLLDRLRRLIQRGASAVIATTAPNRDQFADMLERYGIQPTELGLVPNSDRTGRMRTPVAIVDGFLPQSGAAPPPEFDVLAVMTAFNEEDVLEQTISHLIADGVRVHVIDNWSRDDTLGIAQGLATTGMVTVEQFPPQGPSDTASWEALLERVGDVAAASGADWVIHHDADEIRYSPWKSMLLRDSVYRVERAGFNAIDFTVIEFWPTDDRPVEDLERDLEYFSFGLRPGHFIQVKGWANWMGSADLASSGGHSARFEGRRVFPYKFLLKHYPIRSQRHGERKVFAERRGRWAQAERQRGWHHQYDRHQPGAPFIHNREDLERFDREEFDSKYLIERLTGMNLPRIHCS